ncbi:hypothetical protein HOY82DRAFT_535889 [Tuber indicum]|nr:hypothetical protein HOY82DRAFT_535889 [Tuber indicum]
MILLIFPLELACIASLSAIFLGCACRTIPKITKPLGYPTRFFLPFVVFYSYYGDIESGLCCDTHIEFEGSKLYKFWIPEELSQAVLHPSGTEEGSVGFRGKVLDPSLPLDLTDAGWRCSDSTKLPLIYQHQQMWVYGIVSYRGLSTTHSSGPTVRTLLGGELKLPERSSVKHADQLISGRALLNTHGVKNPELSAANNPLQPSLCSLTCVSLIYSCYSSSTETLTDAAM